MHADPAPGHRVSRGEPTDGIPTPPPAIAADFDHVVKQRTIPEAPRDVVAQRVQRFDTHLVRWCGLAHPAKRDGEMAHFAEHLAGYGAQADA